MVWLGFFEVVMAVVRTQREQQRANMNHGKCLILSNYLKYKSAGTIYCVKKNDAEGSKRDKLK